MKAERKMSSQGTGSGSRTKGAVTERCEKNGRVAGFTQQLEVSGQYSCTVKRSRATGKKEIDCQHHTILSPSKQRPKKAFYFVQNG